MSPDRVCRLRPALHLEAVRCGERKRTTRPAEVEARQPIRSSASSKAKAPDVSRWLIPPMSAPGQDSVTCPWSSTSSLATSSASAASTLCSPSLPSRWGSGRAGLRSWPDSPTTPTPASFPQYLAIRYTERLG